MPSSRTWHNGRMLLAASSHSTLFDVVLIAHILVGIAALVLVVVTYVSALHLPRGDESAKQFFRPGAQWPLRIVHLLPVTGVVLVLTSHHDFAFSNPFIGIGFAIWFIMSGILEGMVMPSVRVTVSSVAEHGAVDAATLARIRYGLDATAVLLIVAAVVMVAQPGS